jgi:hypothetical protein
MTEFSKNYRYHPESHDTHVLCQHLEDKLPKTKFGHGYIRDLNGSTLLQIQGQSEGRYYAQTLRDSQEPKEIAERFYDRLKPRNPEPSNKPNKLWTPR